MKKLKQIRLGAVVIAILFLMTMQLSPSFLAAHSTIHQQKTEYFDVLMENEHYDPADYILHDRYYAAPQDTSIRSIHNDIGYNSDAGDIMNRAFNIYIGEPVGTGPGQGRIGYLNPSINDYEDWYRFSVCEGQTITASVVSDQGYHFQLYDSSSNPLSNGSAALQSGWYFLQISADTSHQAGSYEIDIVLGQQNDAGTGDDAGNSIDEATFIEPGNYYGYLDWTDHEDWYSFFVNSGKGIYVDVRPIERSDFDVWLYNPDNELVHYESYYGRDTLQYLADQTGLWKIKIDIFPGWDAEKWPDDYYLYGSGLYELEVKIVNSVPPLPTREPQPEIHPIAQTFIVQNDDESNTDEYVYMAAVPAANYHQDGKRFVSPIVYQGDDTLTNWYGTVDDTTQYLIDDWNEYLNRHAMTPTQYHLSTDPIIAASEIAIQHWTSSDKAVIVVDGSNYHDSTRSLINRKVFLNAKTQVTSVGPDDQRFIDIGDSLKAFPLTIGPQWGAIAVHGLGNKFQGDVGITTPRYEALMDDWWPYSGQPGGPDLDLFYPITAPGLWMPYTSSVTGMDELRITQIAGRRFRIPIFSTDSSLKVTVTTEEPTYLRIYLIDPQGNVRRPSMPSWNGGPINPIHIWNGGSWDGIGYDDWKALVPNYSTQHVEEIHYPMRGIWRVIVVPATIEAADTLYRFHINVELRRHSPQRNAAALSASNAAVIASAEHAPLLYVKEDSIPAQTQNALDSLGISEIIFVQIKNIGNTVKNQLSSYSLTDLNTMQKVIDYISDKDLNTKNLITITSLATGDGYYAPASMISAYHTAPILNIGEAPKAYNTIDKIATWREYAGDYYHGCRSLSDLPLMSEPFDFKEFLDNIKESIYPPPGFDLKKRWSTEVNVEIMKMINSYGLDREGKEAYLFVSPRDTDIRDVVGRSMTGNLSYAGQIPVEKPAFSSAVINRNILYPALIYVNPGRDVTTSQLMNYPDGGLWSGNDGKNYPNFATSETKRIFSSDGRFYEGHCIWDYYIERLNAGAALSYYTGHGTGGSGFSAQYRNVNEQFPQAKLTHDHLKDFNWWNSWRGYSGYDHTTTKCPRVGGSSHYTSKEPGLYDFIHFKYLDETLGNLHSMMDFWESCTTGAHFGPMIYLSHGAAFWYGNAGSCYGIQATLHDNWVFNDVMIKGKGIGESFSEYLWIFDRDYTTGDPTTMYGRSTLFQGYLSNLQVFFGDPTMTIYNPNWTEPIPITK